MTGDSDFGSVASAESGAEAVSYASEPAEMGSAQTDSVGAADGRYYEADVAGFGSAPDDLREFEEASEGEFAETADDSASEEHPALEGLPRGVDEEGNELVEFQGAWVDPQFVVELYEQGQHLQQMAHLEEAEAAEWESEQEQLLGDFEQAAVDLLSDSRRRAFPEIPEEQGALLDELLVPYADRMLAGMDWEGLDEEGLLTRMDMVGQELMGRVRDLFTLAAAQQFRDNAQYAELHRVRPDGTPGTMQPEGADIESYLRLPEAKRRGIMERAAAAANAFREPLG